MKTPLTTHIEVSRSLMDCSFYRDPEYIFLFLHLHFIANTVEKRVKVEKTHLFITILPGQVLTSRAKLAEQTGISNSKVERILDALESEQLLEQQTNSKYRVITITNRTTAAKSEQQVEQQTNSSRTAVRQENAEKTTKKAVKTAKQPEIDAGTELTLFQMPTQDLDLSEHYMILNNGSRHNIKQGEVAEWARLFPAVDVPQQLRAMTAWCMANPTQRKTKSGINRFMVRWLSKEQDKPTRGNSANPWGGQAKEDRNKAVGDAWLKKMKEGKDSGQTIVLF